MKNVSTPTRVAMSDAAIDELAAELHLILGELVDDLTFVDLVNAVAGITE